MTGGKVINSMIEKISFRIFLSCLFPTALLMIYQIWTVGPDEAGGPPPVIQLAFTMFVIGLTAFLIWLSSMLYRIRKELEARR